MSSDKNLKKSFQAQLMEQASESKVLSGGERGSFVEREARAKQAGLDGYMSPAKRRMLAIRRLRRR